MTLGDVTDVAAAAIALAAVIIAGIEYRRARSDRAAERLAELDAVGVSWQPTERPNHPDADGTALWRYEITVQNPGRLPIRDVQVTLAFATDVRQLHYDGRIDQPVQRLRLYQPVLLAGVSRTWKRNLIVEFASRNKLNHTTGEVTFVAPTGVKRTNHMNGEAPTIHGPA